MPRWPIYSSRGSMLLGVAVGFVSPIIDHIICILWDDAQLLAAYLSITSEISSTILGELARGLVEEN